MATQPPPELPPEMPENPTPESDQFLKASVQTASVLFAYQSAKTWYMRPGQNDVGICAETLVRTVYPGQTWPMYSEPSGFLSQMSLKDCLV